MVVPDGHDEDHTAATREGLAHLLEAALRSEGVGVAEGGLLLRAEAVGDGVDGVDAGDLREGVGDHLAVLDVEPVDLFEGTRARAGVGDELCHDGELGLRVNLKPGAVEGGVAHAVRIEVASGLVAGGRAGAASASRALSLLGATAGVGGVGSGIAVGLPDVHLVAASTVLACAGIWISGGWSPADVVGLRYCEQEPDLSKIKSSCLPDR